MTSADGLYVVCAGGGGGILAYPDGMKWTNLVSEGLAYGDPPFRRRRR